METESRERKFKEVEKLAKQGAEFVKEGKLKKALTVYESAYGYTEDLGDEKARRACAFNVGAVYIALGFPEKGIEMLRVAERSSPNSLCSTPSGDLYFNLGVANESLQNMEQAINFYKQALELYDKEDDYPNQGSICIKLARIYSQLKYFADSANYYGKAARAFGIHQDLGKQVSCKCEQANQLFSDSKQNEALALAEDCLEKCSKISGDQYLGFMYNDLGLIFTQCNIYDKAEMCFNLGLQDSRKPNGDEKQQAVLLQNLGAIYNFLGDYRRSLQFHEEAATKYAKQKNRTCQGQCFCNQAFAYSQLRDYESASEAFLHALQAAKDSDDKHSRWQILEGLGVVTFIQGNINKSIKFLKEALAAFSCTDEVNSGVQDRLVAKLSKALEAQVMAKTSPGTNMEILIGDVQPTQMLTASFEDKRLRTSGSIPMQGMAAAGSQQLVNGRVVATRPGSRRFQTVPRGLSLESFGERVFRHEGVVWGQDDLSQPGQDVGQHNGTFVQDVHISKYEEAIRKREREEVSDEETVNDEESYSSEEDSDEEWDSEEYESSSEEYSTEDSDYSAQKGGKPDQGILVKPSTSQDSRDRSSNARGVSFKKNGMPDKIHEPVQGERISSGQIGSTPLQENKEDSIQETEATIQPESAQMSSIRGIPNDIKAADETEESGALHITTENKTVQETFVGHGIADKGQLADDSDDRPVIEAALIGGINGDRSFPQSAVVKEGTVAEHSSADETSEYRDEDTTDEEDITHRVSGHDPALPIDSAPRTLLGTYEVPVLKGKAGDHRPTQNFSPDYAEIDFTASGRPISGSTPRSSASGERAQTSNFFHSDDEGEMKVGAQPVLCEEEEEEEGLYESIHPREEGEGVAQLPRGHREQLLYQEHQKQLAQEAEKKPEEKSRSRMCTVM
ncbi:uncharacterized protein LOC135472807 [Liolophura sinensis]|uniref:uncharacterized protein LOC135472807 n=1 Tax=Liolophura sinensis TaxID=3198878 RepID=UPI0031581475